MFKLSLGYPDERIEKLMVQAQSKGHPLDTLQAVTDMDEIIGLQQKVQEVHVDEAVSDYIVAITRKTRDHSAIFLGASPRATLALMNASKAYAYVNERDYVIPDDVKYLSPYVLGHRLILHSEARMEGASIQSILQSIFEQVKVPVRLEK